MFEAWLYAIISVVIVSLIAFIGLITLSLTGARLKSLLLFFVSFAAGALIGDVFFHLFPEIVEEAGFNFNVSSFVLAGIFIFFILEKFLHWRHCHEPTCDDHPHTLATINLVGDGLHNFIDGMIIGGSYLVSLPLGLATTLAVILHEIPQEIGDFSILLYAGLKRGKALLLNFLSALLALAGVILILLIGQKAGNLTSWLLPLTAGGFIYIAVADLIPELHKEVKPLKSLIQLFSIFLGIGVMALLLLFE